MRLPFYQTDVFTDRIFGGNPLAVFLDADNLDRATMQSIAREMNLSETTFVQTAHNGGDVRVKIFTPGKELPFAGHPTIGTADVLYRLGKLPSTQFSFEMGVGIVPLQRDEDGMFWMRPPQPVIEGSTARVSAGGNPFRCVLARSKAEVDAFVLDRTALATDDDILVFCYQDGSAYSRMLASPALGIGEDPATGSSVAPLIAFLAANGNLEPERSALVVEQGTRMGRQSFLHARFSHQSGTVSDIRVGGTAVPVFESVLTL